MSHENTLPLTETAEPTIIHRFKLFLMMVLRLLIDRLMPVLRRTNKAFCRALKSLFSLTRRNRGGEDGANCAPDDCQTEVDLRYVALGNGVIMQLFPMRIDVLPRAFTEEAYASRHHAARFWFNRWKTAAHRVLAGQQSLNILGLHLTTRCMVKEAAGEACRAVRESAAEKSSPDSEFEEDESEDDPEPEPERCLVRSGSSEQAVKGRGCGASLTEASVGCCNPTD